MSLSRTAALSAPLLVVVGLAAVWARYGALAPAHGHGAGGGPVDLAQFESRVREYAEAHGLPDGSVEAQPGSEPVPVLLRQFGFQPRELRMRTGEHYSLELLAIDVIHGFSLYAGLGSMNALLVPGQPVLVDVYPTRPGRYLVVCNEYCGLGHHVMSGAIIVEGEEVHHDDEGAPHDDGGHEATAMPSHDDGGHGAAPTPHDDAEGEH